MRQTINPQMHYARLKELTNEHGTLRQMLGHGPYCSHSCHIQTLQDNISHFTPEILDQINQIVVTAGHILVKKEESLHVRADSFRPSFFRGFLTGTTYSSKPEWAF